MRIFYDGVIFTQQKYGGINRIYEQLVDEIPRFAPDADIRCYRFPPELESNVVFRPELYFTPKIGGALRRIDNHLLLSCAIRRFNPDIYHPTYYRFPEGIDPASVVTVHDMIYELYPDSFEDAFEISARKHDCVERADHVIAVSENTKRDLMAIFDIPPEKISVIHLAASPFFKPVDEDALASLRASFGIQDEFLLYVGGRAHYKNFKTLLEAYADWMYAGDIPLVCVGIADKWTDMEASILANANISDSVELVGEVRDVELRLFYNAAIALVYPSQYEGFGIPPLEAMQCGTPVVASNASSIPEVVGDAGIYIDPHNKTDIREALTTVVSDATIRDDLIELGFKQANMFDWERTARQTFDVYQQIVE